MFLCDKCHDPKQHLGIFVSRGACESCGKVANCIDCKLNKCPPVKKKEESK